MYEQQSRYGVIYGLPILGLLAASFLAPLLLVLVFSFMPPKSFDLLHMPTLENFRTIIAQGYYSSLIRSLGLSVAAVTILLAICYPLAYAMARIFGRFSTVITVLVVAALFVSENIRLFGWVLVFMRGGMLSGSLRAWFGVDMGTLLYNAPIIVFGLVYVYLPFMLFPLVLGISMIPEELRHAARDLGASRWRVLREVDLPLAMPGILVGSLLTFALCTGAMLESQLLGGQKVIVMANEIETAFTYGQNWPLGSALSVLLMVLIAAVSLWVLQRVDLDEILGKV